MKNISASLSTLGCELTSHAQGLKQVFLSHNDTQTNLTQFAYGEFNKADYCELHMHATMEEYFFFLEGKGAYIVGNEAIDLHAGVFVRIPAGILHRLEVTDLDTLKYIYFGVATE